MVPINYISNRGLLTMRWAVDDTHRLLGEPAGKRRWIYLLPGWSPSYVRKLRQRLIDSGLGDSTIKLAMRIGDEDRIDVLLVDVLDELARLREQRDREIADRHNAQRQKDRRVFKEYRLRACPVCGEPIPASARVDRKTCSAKCRMALHRQGALPVSGALYVDVP